MSQPREMLGDACGRRDLLMLAASAMAGGAVDKLVFPPARADSPSSLRAAAALYGIDVRSFGALGDGKAIDTPAVNRAIEAAASQGGGIVRFPPGVYACYSVRLKSFVALYLEPGAVIRAAEVPHEGTTSGGYDAAEPNAWDAFQDFGHSHWRNSLIWGKGLSRGHSDTDLPIAERPGVGNKAIALKNCRNVVLRDFAILSGGHFGILATGADNLTIEDLRIDTNRDGINVDCCRNVRIANCSVNSPWDDAICLKSSFALGLPRPTENVTISDCYVTGGYRVGTLLDGTWRAFGAVLGERVQMPTGRIKLGTESNGGFKNIAVMNCVLETSRGLALECVDGGTLEDVVVSGISMRDVRSAPLFLRLGARLRGPPGTEVGILRRVRISDVNCFGPESDTPSIIAGIPGYRIEDVVIDNVRIEQKGGGAETASRAVAELEKAYPEPEMFGPLPAQGFFIRHGRDIAFGNVEIASAAPDARPIFRIEDVDRADFFRIALPKKERAAAFVLHDVARFRVFGSAEVPDTALASTLDQRI